MLSACTSCAVKQREIPKPKRPMSGWICYLKTCAKETDTSYMDCIKNSDRKEEMYKGHEDEWKREALNKCPRGI